jgi:hypothetical protein
LTTIHSIYRIRASEALIPARTGRVLEEEKQL